jgi:hypothetical protein
VNCGVSFPYNLAAGQNLVCTYTYSFVSEPVSLPSVATVTLQNSPSGSTSFTGNATVTSATATANEVDKSVTVTDGADTLGTASDTKSFVYAKTLSFATCGPQTVSNTATLTTSDTHATASATATVAVTVPCVSSGGCTLSQGYWKNHAESSKHYDSRWAVVGGSGSQFFLSGKTWLQVFGTSVNGNAYYQLADQYMAAKLNVLNGASNAVASQMSQAESLFATYTPANASTASSTVKAQFTNLASTLGSYNEGAIGPGKCSE